MPWPDDVAICKAFPMHEKSSIPVLDYLLAYYRLTEYKANGSELAIKPVASSGHLSCDGLGIVTLSRVPVTYAIEEDPDQGTVGCYSDVLKRVTSHRCLRL